MEKGRFKILTIDDNQDNLLTYKVLIGEFFPGAVVLAALNGPEGIALAEAEDPDVILLDMFMPGMDGIEVCRKLKANNVLREIPVVFVTAAKADRDRRILALETGAEAFLTKPVDESELTAQIRAMLKIRDASLQKRNENERLAAMVQEKTSKLNKAHSETLQLLEQLKNENSARIKSESCLLDAQRTAHIGSFEYDANTGRLSCTDEALSICGIEPSAYTGKPEDIFQHIHPDDTETVRSLAIQATSGGDMKEVECRILRPDSEERFVSIRIAPAAVDSGHGIRNAGTIQDITERKLAEKRLRESEEKYRVIAESVSDVIWVYNVNQHKLTYVSPSVHKLRGITTQEAMEENTAQTMPPASYAVLKERFTMSIEELKRNSCTSNAILYEVLRPCNDGTFIWIEDAIRSRYNADGDIEIFGISRNIHERKEQEDKLRYMSFHDQLTGLYNRRFFEEELKRLDTQRNLPISIVMGDINGLKLINDSFGHAVGDQLLEKTAQILRKVCRADDIIARLGGDEFVVLLPKTNASVATQIISRIKSLMAAEKVANIELSFSFGYETKEAVQQNMLEVLANAENHMYRNKLYERSSMRSKTVDIIMNTLFEKSSRELMHSKRVSEICRAIASMMDLDKDFVNQIGIAGLVHDIGKIGVDEKILNKVGKLTGDEWQEIVKHPETGWRILSSTSEFSEVARFILEHHEKWDGSGYPKGLKGEEISLEARIISIADAYDAMTSKRTYGDGISREKAVEEIKRCSGAQFDPAIVDGFLNCILKTGGDFSTNE